MEHEKREKEVKSAIGIFQTTEKKTTKLKDIKNKIGEELRSPPGDVDGDVELISGNVLVVGYRGLKRVMFQKH